MADIRINQLPNEPAPSGADFVAIDLASTRKTTVTLLTEAGRPAASQAEAEAGTNPTKAMTPLTTAQAIAAQGAAQFQPLSTKLTNLDGTTINSGYLVFGASADTWFGLPPGADNQFLTMVTGNPTWVNAAAGGDVTGPASSISGTLPTYNGVTGKVIQAGNPLLLDFMAASRGPMPTLANNVTDATNDIDFSAGAAFSSDATNWPMVGTALTKQLDAAWAVGNNAGGRMSAAAIANTTYHCYMIRRPDTGVVDYGFDTSATAPTLPTNYTQYRRIGSIIRASAAILLFKQTGNYFALGTRVQDWSVANPGTAAVTRTLTVPLGIQVRAKYSVSINDNTGTIYVTLTDLAQADVAAGNSNYDVFTSVTSGFTPQTQIVETTTNTSAQIRSRLSASTANTAFSNATQGWTDLRGQSS